MGGGVSTAVKQTVEENNTTNLVLNNNNTSTTTTTNDGNRNSNNTTPSSSPSNKPSNIETLLTTPRTPREIDGNPKQKFETGIRNNHQGGPPLTLDNLSPTHNPFKSKYQLKRDEPLKVKEQQQLKLDNTYLEVIEGKTSMENEEDYHQEGKPNNDDITANNDASSKVDEKVDDTNMMMLKSTSTFIDSNNDRTNPETLLISRDMSNNNSSMDNLSLQSANGNHNLSSNSLNSNNSNSSNKTQFNRPVVHKRKKKKPKTTNNLFPIDNENKKLQGTDIVENEPPPEPEPQYIILDLPKDDLPHPSLPLGPPTDEVKESFESKRFLSGIDGLKQRWGEVQFLLRINIEKENNNFDLVHQTSHQSILFLEEMKTMAKEYGVLQGALSQWLMPFDSNTSASDQTSIRRLRKGEHGSRLDEVPDEKRIEMIKKLIDLRKLVKVKIADDNDLDLARRTVIDIDAFCRLLAAETDKRNNEKKKKENGRITPFDILTNELL